MGHTQRFLAVGINAGTTVRNGGILLLFCVLPALCYPALILEPYPGSQVVNATDDGLVASRRIILGALKKINNVLEPKFYEYISGTQSSTTYYVPGERRVDRVVEFYRDQLAKSTRVLFRCEGRSCGSSNYWANTVFKTPLLYGPEQYQNYMIARDLDTNAYIAIYVGQRGTKKIYIQVQITNSTKEGSRFIEGSLIDALQTRGRFVIKTEDFLLEGELIREVAEFLKNNRESRLTLVAHGSLEKGESTEDGLRRTLRLANSVRSELVAAGIGKDRLQAYGVGPLSPLGSEQNSRLELLLIQ